LSGDGGTLAGTGASWAPTVAFAPIANAIPNPIAAICFLIFGMFPPQSRIAQTIFDIIARGAI
jgi:hypothetical protein